MRERKGGQDYDCTVRNAHGEPEAFVSALKGSLISCSHRGNVAEDNSESMI